MLDESINLLEELDNVSKIHILERDDIDALILEFAKRIVITLRIERLNIWLFNVERDALVSIAEFDSRTALFSKNSTILRNDYPLYFEAISENKIILAPNVYNHPATSQFSETYLKPNDIISVMDVPLRMEGQLIGVICFEKTGETERNFSETERTFGLSLSTVLASNLEARHRRAAQYKLEAAIKEKELLIQEINHRVKNNFSILISLLRLSRQQGRTTDPATILEEYEQRVFSMLKIQELLYQTKNYTSVNLCDYINELVNEFKRSHPEIASCVNTSVAALSSQLPSKIAINLGLVLTEIFLNSVKHAHGKVKNYELTLTLTEKPANHIILKVGDSGDGFDFNENLRKDNLGLHLIKSLAEDMEMKSKYPAAGSNFYEFSFTNSPT